MTLPDKKCPRCELWNSGGALVCDCGYDFKLGQVTVSPLTLSAAAKPEAKRSLWDRKPFRLALFAGTYVAAIAINEVRRVFIGRPSIGDMFDPLLGGLTLLTVPAGLTYPFEKQHGGGLVGWADALLWNVGIWLIAGLILLSISSLAIVLPSRQVSKVLYIIFVILVIFGTAGGVRP